MNKKLTLLECLQFLWPYARKHRRNFLLFYFGWLVETFLEAIIPIMLALMVDEMVYHQNLDFFLRISLIFIVSNCFACLLFFVLYTIHHYLMTMVTFDIKKDIFKHAINAKAEHLTNASSGDIITMLSTDTVECMHMIIRNIFHFINGILKLVFYISFVWLNSWKVGLLLIITVPVSLFITRYYSNKARIETSKYRDAYGQYVSWTFEILKGLREIRLLAAEKSASILFIRHFKRMVYAKVKASVVTLKVNQLTSLIRLVLDLSLYALVGFLAVKGEITLGFFIAIAEYFRLSNNTISFLSNNNISMHSRITNVQRIYDFLQNDIEDDRNTTSHLNVKMGSIFFSSVSFSYNGSMETLKNINLQINSGEHLAIVGMSGSGKTTLVNLLLRFYEPDSGHISIDDTDISSCSLKSLRECLGVVQQDVLVFDESIRLNLALGKKNATEQEMLVACDKAAIGDFIRQLPKGLDTKVGRCGIELSGGQKQRLAIARIYLKDPKIFIFDEATSSLDHVSEKLIHKAWRDLSKGRTTITIAHRLSSVLECDRVAVIHEGRIVSTGFHSELIKNCPYYRSLFLENYSSLEVPAIS